MRFKERNVKFGERNAKRLILPMIAGLIPVLCLLAAGVWAEDTFTILASFNDSANPWSETPVQGPNGSLYGTTLNSGDYGRGMVFEITPEGKLTTLYSFCSESQCADGSNPFVGLVLATDGNFYGTTGTGGANDFGTFFKITPAGKLSTLHSFTNYERGLGQIWALLQASDGNFYTTTDYGGNYKRGSVLKITPGGEVTILHSFCSTDCTDGEYPSGGLVQGTDGNFYGTTEFGGTNGYGNVFKITPAGELTTLYSFGSQPDDGKFPGAGLFQGANGNFYGTTSSGGAYGKGEVFEITPGGQLAVFHSFEHTNTPDAALVQATNGSLWGTTEYGGPGVGGGGGTGVGGTAFGLYPGGKLITIHDFCLTAGCPDGQNPTGLVQATNGKFYGTSRYGGASMAGTVYSWSVGFGPFVKPVPASGSAGTSVILLGNNLTGTTSVTFNGMPTTFTVVSDTEITATVPEGATTGKVMVTTPTRTLTSNVNFHVS
jgi:uncharacterized repeat protein (TIGR03803 family)